MQLIEEIIGFPKAHSAKHVGGFVITEKGRPP